MKLYLLLLLLLVPLVYAEPATYFAKGEIPDLKVPCIVNNTACSNATNCSITIFDPKYNAIVENKQMTYNPTFFNFTLPRIDDIGEYKTAVYCNDSGVLGSSTFSFMVTNNGLLSNDYAFIIGLAVVVAVLFFLAIKIDTQRFPLVQPLLLLFGILYLLMIPSFFVISDAKSITYYLTTGLITIMGFYIIGYLAYLLMIKFGMIVPKEGNR